MIWIGIASILLISCLLWALVWFRLYQKLEREQKKLELLEQQALNKKKLLKGLYWRNCLTAPERRE